MERTTTFQAGLPGRDYPEDHVLFSEPAPFGDMGSPLNVLIEAIPNAIFVVEKLPQEPEDWRLIAINTLHSMLTGLGPQQGGLFSAWCPRELRDHLFYNYSFAISQWDQISYDEELDLPAGRKWWSTTLMPFKSPSGRLRVLGSSQDISRTKYAEGALSTFLPICSVCKSVQVTSGKNNEASGWVPIETYLREKRLTHGYCPDCFERLYGHLKFDSS